jgi:hypothetical protein
MEELVMANIQELSLSQAASLLGNQKQPGTKASWLTPHRHVVREAVEQNRSFVMLDGVRFKLSITEWKFHLRPVRGFAPMGWWLKSWLYETED